MSDDNTQGVAEPKRSGALTRLEYEDITRPVRRVLAEQRLALDHYLEDMGDLTVRLIEQRVKSFDSIVEHQRSGRRESVDEFRDLAGMRIVVHARVDEELIAAFFYRQVERKDAELLEDRVVDNAGYKARHIVLKIRPSYRRSGHSVKMEVQIRTLAHDVFNTISRAYWYKFDDAEPSRALRKDLVAHLEAAERLVSEIREGADEAFVNDSDAFVTPFAYRRLVQTCLGHSITMLEAVDQVFMIRDRGMLSNGQLRSIFTDPKVGKRVSQLVDETDGFIKGDHQQYLEVHALSEEEFVKMKTFWVNYSLK